MLVAIVAAASLAACGGEGDDTRGADRSGRAAPTVAAVNQPAPDFELAYHGTDETMRLSDLRGQVVLVNFWGTWCPPCKAELPDLVSLHNDYKDQGVEFLGVLVHRGDHNAAEVEPLVDQFGIEYENVTGEQSVFRAYQISAVPTSYLIDREGVIRKQFVGAYPRASFERELVRVLEQ